MLGLTSLQFYSTTISLESLFDLNIGWSRRGSERCPDCGQNQVQQHNQRMVRGHQMCSVVETVIHIVIISSFPIGKKSGVNMFVRRNAHFYHWCDIYGVGVLCFFFLQ